MLNYVFEGIRAGVVLSILVGPLLVLLLQLSLRRGTMMALVAAVGIWVSDLLLVLTTYYGMGSFASFTDQPYFAEVVGTLGMLLLVGMAAILWYRRPIDLDADRPEKTPRGVLSCFFQGFAINTFNPFTIGFWSFFSITQVHDQDLSESAAWAVYAGILGTIILTDLLKVVGAKKLREILRPEVLLQAQRFGALVLAVFGVVLGVRVWW